MKPNLNDLKIYSEFAVATIGNDVQIIKEGEQWETLSGLYKEILDVYKPDKPTEVNDPSIEWDGDRWRCQVYNSAYGWGCALRRNPSKIPHLVEELKFIPNEIMPLTQGTGLVLIAGPTGGSKEKPVGTVWTAIASPKGVRAIKYQFGAERLWNVKRSANAVLLDFLHHLESVDKKVE